MRSMNEFELSLPEIRTALMLKGELIGVIGLVTSEEFAQVGRFDPRTGEPRTSRWDDSRKARRGFKNMLRSSVENGWEVFYDGQPLVG